MRNTPHALVDNMPDNQRPLSERYRVTANAWVQLDKAARLLEERKTSELERRKTAVIRDAAIIHEHIAENKAERLVKSSDDWFEYLEHMISARAAADELFHELHAIRMEEREIRAANEAIAAEMRLTGR